MKNRLITSVYSIKMKTGLKIRVYMVMMKISAKNIVYSIKIILKLGKKSECVTLG